MSAALVAGLLAGFGIAMPVGAVATYLVALTARTSLRTGAAAALGVATADGLYALLATAGGSWLTHLIEPLVRPLRWVSVAVLVVLALHGTVAAVRRHRDRSRRDAPPDETSPSSLRAYLSLLGLTMLNPLTVIYFAALVLGSRSAAAPDHLEQTVFVLAAFAASAGWQLLLACGGALLGRTLTGDRGRLLTAAASSLLITGLAVDLLVRAP